MLSLKYRLYLQQERKHIRNLGKRFLEFVYEKKNKQNSKISN